MGEKYKVGDTVKGVIIKQNQHGAFASIESGVSGLIHISNYKDEDELYTTLEIGKTYPFVISNFIPLEQKLTLIPENKYKESESQKGNKSAK